jgi:Uma2 family endonuclease
MSAIAPQLQVHRWNYEEWDQMVATGFFEGKRVELIDGKIVDISPQLPPHTIAILLATEAMRGIFPPSRFHVRVQVPLRLGNDSELEPDVAVVKGSLRDASRTEHPSTALLVIEVADDSLKRDRDIKADLYAAAAIPEYWIVNLPQRQCEVRRKPVRDAKRRFGYRYSHVAVYKSGESIAPLAAKSQSVAVADLLP